MFGWILTGFTLCGSVLIAKKRIEGYYAWLIGNGGWLIISIDRHDWPQVALWGAFCLLCFYGIYNWRKDKCCVI